MPIAAGDEFKGDNRLMRVKYPVSRSKIPQKSMK
jgi:hypothetical protein